MSVERVWATKFSTRGFTTMLLGMLACTSEQATTEPSAEKSLAVVAGGRYNIVDLGTLGGTTSRATGVNNKAQVVGWSYVPEGNGLIAVHPFVWKNGVMRDLGFRVHLPHPVSINGEGQVVGAVPVGGYFHAFLWDDGNLKDLGVLTDNFPGCCSRAAGINNAGKAVGASDLNGDSGRENPFIWQNGVMTDLGLEGVANGINAAGKVVGRTVTDRAFMWSNGAVTDLGTLGGARSEAYAINGGGQVVGWSLTATGQQHAFLWKNGVMKDLGTLSGGTASVAYGINDLSQVVGMSLNANGRERAFLWDGRRMINLGTLGGTASKAFGINLHGRVVGESLTKTGRMHATLWQPVRP